MLGTARGTQVVLELAAVNKRLALTQEANVAEHLRRKAAKLIRVLRHYGVIEWIPGHQS